MALIAVDFDHTIVDGATLLEGARESINILRENGHKILIHSCNGTKWIKSVLDNNDVRYDDIWEDKGKPIADLYLDDKGFRFTNWEENLPTIITLLYGFDNRKWGADPESFKINPKP